MKSSVYAAIFNLVSALPMGAECVDGASMQGAGEIATKGGGVWQFALTVGGPADVTAYLLHDPVWPQEPDVALKYGYHIGFAGEGAARLLAPDAAAAEAKGTDLSVSFLPKGKLPEPVPGKVWKGKFSAWVYAQAKGDYNIREIGTAKLDGSYTFLDEKRADISGCSYRIIPVEMKLTYQGETALQRRLLYFPDLQVAAVTIWGPDADGGQRKTGITGIGYVQ